MIRLFVAFPIRDKWADEFESLAERNSKVKGVRWTPKENLHVTFFFIGETEEENGEKIKSVLQEIFARQKSFSMTLETNVFAGKKKPSMLWARFKKNESFSELSETIFHSVKNFMVIEKIHADPVPHCTLARLKPSAEASSLKASIDYSEFNEMNIDKAELFQTIRTKDRVRYESLEKYIF